MHVLHLQQKTSTVEHLQQSMSIAMLSCVVKSAADAICCLVLLYLLLHTRHCPADNMSSKSLMALCTTTEVSHIQRC